MSETSLDGSEAAPTAAHILGDAPTDGAEAQAVTAGAGHGHQEPNASPEDTTSWSDLGTDDLHGDGVVVAPPATTTQPAPALSELAAERDALRERLLAVTAERDELRPRLPAEYVVVRADEALRTVSVLRRYGSFTAAQDLRLRLGAFDDTDWLVAGLAAERDPDAPARYCGTVFRDEYIYLDVRPPTEDDDASDDFLNNLLAEPSEVSADDEVADEASKPSGGDYEGDFEEATPRYNDDFE